LDAPISGIEGKLDDPSYGLSALNTDLDTLLGRLTETRATYLDNLPMLDVAVSTRALETGGRLEAIQTDVNNMESLIKFPSASALDDISVTTPTSTTELSITVSLPSGASIVRAMLAGFITAMNNTANAQKIDLQVQGRVAGGTWITYFSQPDCIGFPAVDGATTGIVPLQDVSDLVTGTGTYGFRCVVTLSAAYSVRFTTQYLLIITYRMA